MIKRSWKTIDWLRINNLVRSFGADIVDGFFIAIKRDTKDYIIVRSNDGHYIPTETTLLVEKAQSSIYPDVDRINKTKRRQRTLNGTAQ